MSQKDELFYRILNTAIVLEMRHGHLKWKMSQLAKLSKVSRPLIYYYFGKSKENIIREAISFFGTEFSGNSQKRWQMWREGNVVATLLESRAILEQVPALVPFYFINRKLQTDVGESIRKQESNFRKKIKQFFPSLTKDQHEFMFACIWGLVFAPELSKSSIPELDEYLQLQKS